MKNGEIQKSRLLGVLNWWKDICNMEVGEYSTINKYLVKEVYKSLVSDDQPTHSHPWTKILNKANPLKVSCLVWRFLSNKIPTKENLDRRGMLAEEQLGCTREHG